MDAYNDELKEMVWRCVLSFAVDGVHCMHLAHICWRWRSIIQTLPFWSDQLLRSNKDASLLDGEKSWRDAWFKVRALRDMECRGVRREEIPCVERLSDDVCQILAADNQEARRTLLARFCDGYRIIRPAPPDLRSIVYIHDQARLKDGEDHFAHALQIVDLQRSQCISSTFFCTDVFDVQPILTDSFCVLIFTHEVPLDRDHPQTEWTDGVKPFDFTAAEGIPLYDTFLWYSMDDLTKPVAACWEPDGEVSAWKAQARGNAIFYRVESPVRSQRRVRRLELDFKSLRFTSRYVSDPSLHGGFVLDAEGNVQVPDADRYIAATRFDLIVSAPPGRCGVRDRHNVTRYTPRVLPTSATGEHVDLFVSPCEGYLISQNYEDISGPQQWAIYDLLERNAEVFVASSTTPPPHKWGESLIWVVYRSRVHKAPQVTLLRYRDGQYLEDTIGKKAPGEIVAWIRKQRP